jgi:hypothetical protein
MGFVQVRMLSANAASAITAKEQQKSEVIANREIAFMDISLVRNIESNFSWQHKKYILLDISKKRMINSTYWHAAASFLIPPFVQENDHDHDSMATRCQRPHQAPVLPPAICLMRHRACIVESRIKAAAEAADLPAAASV